MRALSSLLHRLLGPAEEDHLTGAVDLFDSAYCFELLSRNRADDGAAFLPPAFETQGVRSGEAISRNFSNF